MGTKMTQNFTRRLILAAAFAVVMGNGAGAAQQMDGTVTFVGGQHIPAGTVQIVVEGPGDHALAKTHISSDGTSRQIAFALPARVVDQRPAQIVVTLLRSDGWLLARGSASLSLPLDITLYAVMY